MTTCRDCERLLRPRGTKAADHPGTIAPASAGRCWGCYERMNRGGRPADNGTIELVRWEGSRYDLVRGRFVNWSGGWTLALPDGSRSTFKADEWMEVIA